MPRVENTSERPYGLSAAGFAYVTIPPARVDTHGTKTNGSADVDAEMLKLVKSEAWGEAVFGCGDLVEVSPPAAVELTAEEKAAAEAAKKAEAEAIAKAAEEEARVAAEQAVADAKPKAKTSK